MFLLPRRVEKARSPLVPMAQAQDGPQSESERHQIFYGPVSSHVREGPRCCGPPMLVSSSLPPQSIVASASFQDPG